MPDLQWAVGVTTCPERACVLLPRTLESLRRGGFTPRLFADGCNDPSEYAHFGLEVTCRYPAVGAFGNFWLGIWELYIRHPHADLYYMSQDDVVTYRNLRQYIEATPLLPNTYANLCTYPQNHDPAQKGWYLAPSKTRRGLGAQGLIFNRHALVTLLGKPNAHIINKPQTRGGKTNLDGAVVDTLGEAGVYEACHNPSLVYHTGEESTLRKTKQPETAGFLGEEFDALDLLKRGDNAENERAGL